MIAYDGNIPMSNDYNGPSMDVEDMMRELSQAGGIPNVGLD